MENPGRQVKKASHRLKSGTGPPDLWAFIRSLENANSAKPRLGKGKNPQDENLRFGQAPFLHFPPTDIAEIIEGGKVQGVDATIILYFFGLLGVNGPMPLEFTNYIFRRSHNYFDNTWRRFLDIIHHRFMTFYYRAFSANQQAISFDRNDDDPLSFIIKSLAGFSPMDSPSERQSRLMLKSARQFSFLAKNHCNMEDMLRRLFGLNLKVKDFISSTRDIPYESRTILGNKNTTLGFDLQIGSTYMSITGKFEIHIGPLSFEEYRSFMTRRNGAQFMAEALNMFMDRPMDYSLVFTLKMKTIPLARLGFDLEEALWDAPQLGYTCWIGNPQEEMMVLKISSKRK